MPPNGMLTEDRVWRMIRQEIDKEIVEIEHRQERIIRELQEVKGAISGAGAIQGFKKNAANLLLTAGLLIVGIIELLKR
jgi:hypothetical protein